MNNYNRNQELTRKYIRELIDDGLKQMKDYNLSEDLYGVWLKYSQQVLEITTKDYNPAILLNYLSVIMSINPQLKPYQKIGICLDYLIGILRII
ncbi:MULTISPECIES: hypothetical protein [Bacteroidales]|jgi:hypothetical protein|uniref:Uncharacterized protein n=3 Tax=Bacteroidales TaxID=171549 RepID=A0A1C7GWY4_9BACE|nr:MULTISPECIES: hypothetical protein [Bacteroidales]MCX4260181.1 hypothetical protein [Muribaculaceae bacterium]ANU56854.1 hypothetical protein A4V03_04100 [Bacteroides caecimuris]EDV04808.1 hypothetical protein BACINT_03949 [Bacteroides intestinalis DSM 17393]MCR2007703.1 hypothetical protein [Bacteroides acidifaciens]NBH87574.1 hypothetical protein [Parabacteroides distasonis]